MPEKKRIFISSVQREFAAERTALRDYLRGDPLLRRFFDVFLFEDAPAADRRADELYLDEVGRCDIYLGLFGDSYGSIDAAGVSPTEREFERATVLGKHRLIFVGGGDGSARHPAMQRLVVRAGEQLVRRRFMGVPELLAAVYASLVEFLAQTGMLRTAPLDAAACRGATLADLDSRLVETFLARAQSQRGFPLGPGTPVAAALTHLNLLEGDTPKHAALLLFGRDPQRWLPASAVKCLHFHGTVVEKPIPSHQVYHGTVFALVDQAIDFVMSKVDRTVGTRAASTAVPVAYELPREAVAEAIVNAVAHRDYTSNASVQVMLFSDRLEIWNPGELPAALTPEHLARPHASIPRNPLLADPLFLAHYIEQAGTGTLDMIARCRQAGLRDPGFRQDGGSFVQTLWRPAPPATAQVATQVTAQDKRGAAKALGELAALLGVPVMQVTPQVAEQVATVLRAAVEPAPREQLQEATGLQNREHFRKTYLEPLVGVGWLERTIPDKPTSRLQRYILSAKGRSWLERMGR